MYRNFPVVLNFGFLPTGPTTELVQHVRARKHNASVRGLPVHGRQVVWATHMTMSTTLYWSWPPLARCRRPTVGPCSGCAPSDDRHSTTLWFRPTYRRRAHCSANLCTVAPRWCLPNELAESRVPPLRSRTESYDQKPAEIWIRQLLTVDTNRAGMRCQRRHATEIHGQRYVHRSNVWHRKAQFQEAVCSVRLCIAPVVCTGWQLLPVCHAHVRHPPSCYTVVTYSGGEWSKYVWFAGIILL